MVFARPFLALGLCGFVALSGLGSGAASAQQVFRLVTTDGRVTFSDMRVPGSTPVVAIPLATASAAATPEMGALPFGLRQVAIRYPVTLFSGPGCAPCAAGRAMLAGRGIPFSEKSVSSAEDIEALKRLAAVPSLPLLMIGGQQLNGYSDVEWGQFLDAAGYPKTSQLPTGYQAPPVTSLVAAQEPKTPARAKATPGASATADATPPSPPPAPDRSGIQF